MSDPAAAKSFALTRRTPLAMLEVMTCTTGPVALCSYDVDASLAIVTVDDGWTQFALANGAPELVPPGPIGKPVVPDSVDPTTRFIYRELFARTASTGKPATFDLRCDGPEVRRYLELTISRRDGGFTVSTQLLRLEPNPGGHILAAGARRDPGTLIPFCSWCKRIDAAGEWLELDEGLRRLGLFHAAPVPTLTHGICEPCDARMLRIIDAF